MKQIENIVRNARRPLLVACVLAGLLSAAAIAADSQPHNWRNVQIVGGGFVPGIIYNQTEPGLVYARTDIGGAYRRDAGSGQWIPITDSISPEDWNLMGIASLATDPVNPDNVYLAAGTYTNNFTSQNGAILRSGDRGATWDRTMLPFKLGGNMPGRGCGERLAIDPNNNQILYLGAPSGNGLWRSTDAGVTWSQVTSFPVVGTYRAGAATDSYNGDLQGLLWVTFDQRSGSPGSATQTIYVGVSEKVGPCVYRSTDGGATWAAVPGTPVGYIPHKGILDPVNDYFFIATSTTGGPYDGSKGEVWRLKISTGVWTNISPYPASSSNNYYGYSGLTIDRQNPGTIMVASVSSYWPDMFVFRSKNSGTTWTRIWDWGSYPGPYYPHRTFRYTQDISAAPWLTFNKTTVLPVLAPQLGWMTETMEIDPFDSNKMMYGTGATIYGCDDLKKWDVAGGKISLKVMAQGLEETAIQEIVSPPSGPQLFSGMLDLSGFTHTDVDVVPTKTFTNPNFVAVSIDFAELAPSIVWRVGKPGSGKWAAYSTDSGATWAPVANQPSGLTSGGIVAVGADGARVVWAPGGPASVYYTTNNGGTWTASTGVPGGARVVSDRVNANKFYAFKGGVFYVSTDGGASFVTTVTTGLSTSAKFKAMAGHEGELWLGSGTGTAFGLWRSSDSGASFTQIPGVELVDALGFGKAAPGQPLMAVYLNAKIDGVRGFYRSTDAGATWVRVNDDQHRFGTAGGPITGDPRIYGRVYIGTNGRGILYADALPVISSPATATSTYGQPFSYAITAAESPTSYSIIAGTLPDGLSFNATTGVISGTPTAAGTTTLTVAATNAVGTGTATLTIMVAKAPATLALGGLVQAYDGTPQSVTTQTAPTGLAVDVTYDGTPTAPTYPGAYTVAAAVNDANYQGTASDTLTITTTALVRHAPTHNGGLDGSIQVLAAESFALNGGAWISGDVLVSGTPNVRLNGQPTHAGTIDGTGSAAPATATITLNGNSVVRNIVRRIDPIEIPAVSAPALPTGTRNVVLNKSTDSAGSFATLRHLTLNGNAGQVAVPPGTYGDFKVNANGTLVFGVAGATTPAVYDLQNLELNSGSVLQVIGPVVINLANGVTVNGSVGDPDAPERLTLRIAAGGLTLNGNASLHGIVHAPMGTVTLNGTSTLVGEVSSDGFTTNGDALLEQMER